MATAIQGALAVGERVMTSMIGPVREVPVVLDLHATRSASVRERVMVAHEPP
jgi:hypothetical protein